jgi:general secretion pathway protein K
MRRRGSVLIVTLWALFFLAALAQALHVRARSALRAAAALQADRSAYTAARAGVDRAVAIMRSPVPLPAEIEGEDLFSGSVAGGKFTVTARLPLADGLYRTVPGVLGEEGKVNINKADRELLVAFYRLAGGLTPERASVWAARTLARRGGGPSPAPGDLRAARESAPPQNEETPFLALHELSRMDGMEPDLYRRLAPWLTLYGSGNFDLDTVAEPVLQAWAESLGAGDPSSRRSLIRKIMLFREGGGRFGADEQSARLAQQEWTQKLAGTERAVWQALANRAVSAPAYYRGRSCGESQDNGPAAASVKRCIDFVVERRTGSIVHWLEH